MSKKGTGIGLDQPYDFPNYSGGIHVTSSTTGVTTAGTLRHALITSTNSGSLPSALAATTA